MAPLLLIARALAGCALLLSAIPTHAEPESVPMPVFQSRSTWIYRIHTRDSGKEATEDVQWTLLFKNKKGDWLFSRTHPSPTVKPPEELVYPLSGVTDETWSGRDASGFTEPTRDLLSFPLTPGKTWASHFKRSGSWVTCQHQVKQWEHMEVPAGRFNALRIEYACGQGDQITLRVVQWYVPEVKNFVREVEDLDAMGGDRNVFELLSYKLAAAAALPAEASTSHASH